MSKDDDGNNVVTFPTGKTVPDGEEQSTTDEIIDMDGAISYHQLIVESHRSFVIPNALSMIERDADNYAGKYNITVSFDVTHPQADMPAWVRAENPDVLTIVLNKKYDGLTVKQGWFEVTVYFNGRMAHLCIPFEAILEFVDANNEYGAKFNILANEPILQDNEPQPAPKTEPDTDIVSLDDFRKDT